MLTASKSSYYHSDAPTDYGVGRECSQLLSHCLTAAQTGKRGKVSRYSEPVLTKTDDRDEVVLCSPCKSKWNSERIDSGIDAETFIGRKTKHSGARSTRYKLPNLARIREARGYNRFSLAKVAGMDDGTIKRAEEGEWVGTNPTKKLAMALGVSVGDLRGE